MVELLENCSVTCLQEPGEVQCQDEKAGVGTLYLTAKMLLSAAGGDVKPKICAYSGLSLCVREASASARISSLPIIAPTPLQFHSPAKLLVLPYNKQ